MRVLGRSLSAAIVVLFSLAAQASSVSPQRIRTAIDPSQVAELPGNVSPLARNGIDEGVLPESLAVTEITLHFSMTAAQQAALNQLLIDQQNPASPKYHQWLTPEDVASQFGMAASDVQKVTEWLTNQGFTGVDVARNRLFVRFNGTAGVVSKAFHTELHRVSVNGEQHIANLTAPALPAAVAAVTGTITGLQDFRARPHSRRMVDTSSVTPAATAAAVANPKYTSAASGNHFVAPGDFATIYDVSPLYTAGLNGSGVTIAVMGQTDIGISDVNTFRSLGGLPVNPPTIKLYGTDPGTVAADLPEALLDVEWSGGIAPSASILFVNSKDVFNTSLISTISDNLAPVISLSYGYCESAFTASTGASLAALLQVANAQGQTVVDASGDWGATNCDYNSQTVATHGLDLDFPSVLPTVTAVGGTQFNENGGTYWNATNSTTNLSSALSYIPSEVWNETATAGTLTGGGGGASALYPKPYWQTGTGVPADSARDVPDIALHAALYHDAYLICTPGYCTDGYKNSAGNHDIVGGTSVGAPSFAGILALLVQKTGGRLGNANPKIYALANSSFYSTVFHDITVGDNKMPCTAGTQDCPAGGSIGYSAGVGYDLASGWGAIDAFNFVTDWPLVTPAVSSIGSVLSTTAVVGTATSVTQGTSVTFTATVASGSSSSAATPTGTVQFVLDNVAQGSPVALSGGKASFTLATTSVPSGAHNVRAAYSGDTTFAASKGSVALAVISSATPDLTVVPASTSVTTAGGSSGTVVVTVNGLNSFTGTVTLTATTTANASVSFSPTTITLSNTKTTGSSTLTLRASKSSAVTGTSASLRQYGAGSGIALAGLLLVLLPRRRRYMGALVAVFSIGLLALSGCSGGGSAGTTNPISTPNTPAGTYTVTVTATGTSGSTAVTKTATITWIVN